MTPTSTAAENKRVAVFPGSFNPFTVGHADIVCRGLELFDRIIIAVGINTAKHTDGGETLLEPIRRLYAGNSRVEVASYSGLTVDFAAERGARFILRGVRSAKDFEYERDMAQINRQLSGIESVLLFSKPEYAAVSSSVVRELRAFGHDVDIFLPKPDDSTDI